jgi:hypothetical protein
VINTWPVDKLRAWARETVQPGKRRRGGALSLIAQLPNRLAVTPNLRDFERERSTFYWAKARVLESVVPEIDVQKAAELDSNAGNNPSMPRIEIGGVRFGRRCRWRTTNGPEGYLTPGPPRARCELIKWTLPRRCRSSFR